MGPPVKSENLIMKGGGGVIPGGGLFPTVVIGFSGEIIGFTWEITGFTGK